MWSYTMCDSRTGARLLDVTPSAGRWSAELNASGFGAHVFQLGDRELTRELWRDLTTPWSRTLVQSWAGVPVYAGLISGRPYDRDAQRLTVESVDVRDLFRARYPFGVNSYWQPGTGETVPGKLVLSGLSLRAIAARVMQESLVGPESTYSMPINLPSAVEAGAHSRTFENFNFQSTADILSELQETAGGPDIHFQPVWGAGGLEWNMVAGSSSVPQFVGSSFEFNLTAEKHGLSSISLAEDALKQVTGVFGVGQGSGADLIVGGTPGASVAGIPARDVVVNRRMAKSKPEVSAFAFEQVAAFKWPTTQPSYSTLASGPVPVSDLRIGSLIRTFDEGDPWMPDGWSTHRVVGLSGGVDETVKLTVEALR